MAATYAPAGMQDACACAEQNTAERPCLTPDVDIIELPDGFHIFLDMPGINKASLRIDLNENELIVYARTLFDLDKAMRGAKVLAHMEFGGGEYRAGFTLSDDVDRENIRASVHNGVIDIHLPRSQAKPTRIAISDE